MSIQAIIWDLEGVLLRTQGKFLYQAAAERLNLPYETIRPFFYGEFNDRLDKGEYTQDEFWNHILQSLGLPPQEIQHLRDFLQYDFFIDPEMLANIRMYRQSFKTGLLTNFSEVLRPMLNSHWNVDSAFDEIVISCEIGMIKPHADIFKYMLQQLGCGAEEAIFIDDKPINVEGAQRVGIHAFLFTNQQEMNAKIHQIFNSQGSLADNKLTKSQIISGS